MTPLLISPQDVRPYDKFELFGMDCTVVAVATFAKTTSVHFRTEHDSDTSFANLLQLKNEIGFLILR